jgi:hypothetical protein
MAVMEATSAPGEYPVNFEVVRPPSQSRLLNFPVGVGFFIRALLLVPHFVILYFMQIVAQVLYLIASFAILFTGKYPQGMYNFVAGYSRWSVNATGYLLSLYDVYPPFTMDPQAYPLTFSADYPATSSRILNFPFLGLAFKVLMLIPHVVILWFLYIAAFVVLVIAQFAILFNGSFPEGMHRFVTGTFRWGQRLNWYLLGLSDRYPPFTTS